MGDIPGVACVGITSCDDRTASVVEWFPIVGVPPPIVGTPPPMVGAPPPVVIDPLPMLVDPLVTDHFLQMKPLQRYPFAHNKPLPHLMLE